MKMFQGILIAIALLGTFAQAADIRVYSDRGQTYFEKVIQAFTAKTGKTVEIVSGPLADLKARFQNGETGDVLLLKDIRFIADAAHEGYFQRLSEANLNAGVPAFMRDPNGNWTAVTYRVRTIVYDPTNVDVAQIGTYESLTKPEFKGQLCIRNSAEYMPSMVAWLVAKYGEVKATEIVKGWADNATFTAKDPEAISMIDSGACTVGIVNHYYYLRAKKEEQRLSVELLFADQNGDGVHTNGFGGGVMKTAANVDGANEFIAFILSSEGSAIMIQEPSFEYPAVAANKPAALVENLGAFKAEPTSWADIGAQIQKGVEILESVGWAK